MFLELLEVVIQKEESISEKKLNSLYEWLKIEKFPNIHLCNEYIGFLKESNGGDFLNGNREYQWFLSREVKDSYYAYKFDVYMPFAFPFASDGNCNFYIFNLRSQDNKVYTIKSSNMGWDEDECYILAKDFQEMLVQRTSLEDILGRH